MPRAVAFLMPGSSAGPPASGMITMALAPWAMSPLKPEIAFCTSKPALTTIVFLMDLHFAASSLTCSSDALDQPFSPPPSWMPRVIGLSPHHEAPEDADAPDELAAVDAAAPVAALPPLLSSLELPHAASRPVHRAAARTPPNRLLSYIFLLL